MIQCPRCGIQVTELHPVDGDLMGRLQTAGETGVPPEVCAGCLSDLKRVVANSSGGVLMAQERAKEQHRLTLWKSRVMLIKKARMCMGQKLFSEAAISYEKYLKILDIVFDVKKGDRLKPEVFKESARTTELTVVASVYWDLMRIYDTHDKYSDRMTNAAKQLAIFIQFTPIYPDIIRKAESFQKTAKNPQIVKQFLKLANKERPRCFIATAAFENPQAPEVQDLRIFRDLTLKKYKWGRAFILAYYRFSPSFACLLDKQSWLKPAVRGLLRILIKCVS
ncbi:CFI-box-CTERM domain-containing protein [Bdellovibrio sp. HCB2-146]|uniref:CFI-box-CTERM domain-containing protein n=1 Tax=Bdellovibrio sp. HCB2-146 TaxID=3394362 RepID=UPI0039BD0579